MSNRHREYLCTDEHLKLEVVNPEDPKDLEIIEIPMDTIGQRIFTEVATNYYRMPAHGLVFQFNFTHGEFHAHLMDRMALYYLANNTSDIRWSILYVDMQAYGPNPWCTHRRLLERLMENYGTYKDRLTQVLLNDGGAKWEEYAMPQHVREVTRRYTNY